MRALFFVGKGGIEDELIVVESVSLDGFDMSMFSFRKGDNGW